MNTFWVLILLGGSKALTVGFLDVFFLFFFSLFFWNEHFLGFDFFWGGQKRLQ